MQATMPITRTTIFYDFMEDDFETIQNYIADEYHHINNFAEKLPIPLHMTMRVRARGDKGGIGETVEAALKATWNNRKNISSDTWKQLSVIYDRLPKAEKDDKRWRSLGSTTVLLEDETYELITKIAMYIRDSGARIPRMLRGGVGSPRVIVAVAILYVARFYIQELRAKDN